MRANAGVRQTNDNVKSSKREVWSESKLGARYTRSVSATFSQVIASQLAGYDPSKVGSNQRGVKLLLATGLQPEVMAHLFVKTVFSTMPLVHRKRMKRVTLCMRAAELLHDEVRIRHFASDKVRKNLLKKLFAQFDKRTYPRQWRKRTIQNYFHSEQLDWSQWSQREKLLIGYTLLVWFRDGTGLVTAPSNSQFVDPTVEMIEHVQKAVSQTTMDYMLYKPMVVKPRPWSDDNLFRGGYLTSDVRPYSIIKRTGSKDVADMQQRDWSQIIPPLNALQETAWHVNSQVLDVLRWAMVDAGGGFAGLPKANPTPLPAEPHDYRDNEEVRKAHNRTCFLIHSDNRELISKRLMVLSTIGVAQQYREYPAIYFPHNLDSRGRAYPLPVFLQPQGPDYTKALLEFSTSLPINTPEAVCWLAVVGANAYGNDKVSLKDRCDWVRDNKELILATADDPQGDLRWTECSEPFQFLRFCFEWKAMREHGLGFESHMVTYVDATCSGLQHYSAMLRDEVGGKAVNLVPGLPRQDIYQDVADLAIEKLVEAPAENADDAKRLLSLGIGRKTTKRQVMVVPYSGTYSSCMSYTREAIHELVKTGIVCPWDAENIKEDQRHVSLLSAAIWQSIDEVVVKGKLAMTWLTDAAKAHVKHMNQFKSKAHEKAMSWVTPDGFVVIHYRADVSKQRLDTYLDGRVQLTFWGDTPKLSVRDTAQAVAPNFVHSLDACLLRASVVLGMRMGISSYGMIHDSFGVHAANMPDFISKCIKPAFIQMYQRDVLADFRDRLPEGLDLEPLPAKGTLDLLGVQESEFFFS